MSLAMSVKELQVPKVPILELKRIAKSVIPRGWRYQLRQGINSLRSTESVFTETYEKNLWGTQGKKELHSGSGSRGVPAELYAAKIREFIVAHDVSSVLDLGCGDYEIGRKIAGVCTQYTGVDIVKIVVDRNSSAFGSDSVRFTHLNIVQDELPDADLCLVRQVFQHLSNDQIRRILGKLEKYRHVIITEHYPEPADFVAYNVDKPHGPGTRLRNGSAVYLDKPPFSVRALDLILDVAADVSTDTVMERSPDGGGHIRSYLVGV
jgi:SAM-dependent methyltransferase